MKQFFKFLFASVLGFIIAAVVCVLLFVGIISAIVSSAGSDKEVTIEANSILHLKITEPIVDRGSDNPLSNFDLGSFSTKGKTGLNDFLEQIEKAKTDESIKGIFLDVSDIPAGLATIEEMRNKLIEFKSNKKFIVCYSEYLSQSTYYLASVSDEIYLNPQGF